MRSIALAMICCLPAAPGLISCKSALSSRINKKEEEKIWRGIKPTTERNKLSLEMLAYLEHGNFRAIEKRAKNVRIKKERFPGGYWKIRALYQGLSEPKEANIATDADWTKHLNALKRWKAESPGSITASVALATAYMAYAWFARGDGCICEVGKESLELFNQRVELAEKEVLDAKNLREKCPAWFDIMLSVARVKGLEAREYDAVYNEAIAFEPSYYYFYQQKAYNLSPRWNGKPGDWEKFAEDTSSKLGGREGSAMYYLITSQTFRYEGMESLERGTISWEKMKTGYEDLETLYGTENERLNEYAVLAAYARDMDSSCASVQKIGEDWDENLWGKKERFDYVKEICSSRPVNQNNPQIAKEKMPPENEQHP